MNRKTLTYECSRKTPLHIDALWEKATITPTQSCENRTHQGKLALLAEKGIQLPILPNGPPSGDVYPPEPVYEKPDENHTQAMEKDRKGTMEHL